MMSLVEQSDVVLAAAEVLYVNGGVNGRLGHALSVGIIAGLIWIAQATIPVKPIRYAAAAILFGFGL